MEDGAMGGRLMAAVCAAVVSTGAASAEISPYTGLVGRGIKALSEAEVGDLLAGRGAGMALPAELNRYPGPKHVLELATELSLSGEQEAETRRLFERMQAEAVPLGRALVAKEADLEGLFASGAADEEALRALVNEAGNLRGELRFTHLKYHLAMRRLLSPEQVAAYDLARGYRAGQQGGHEAGGHYDGAHH
jgi:Spy/CpxP family protein refolding chaperone